MSDKDKYLLTIFYPEENLSLRGRIGGEASLDDVVKHIVVSASQRNKMDSFLEIQDSSECELIKLKGRRPQSITQALCIVFLVLLLGSLGGIWIYQKHFLHHYGAVFDAGSAHTSLSVYKWQHRFHPHSQESPHLLIDEDITQTMECESSSDSGVSAYSKDPINVRTYIRESFCFNRSKALVPKGSHIFFGATAGMRILKASKPKVASAIMSNITEALSDFRNVNVTIISGVDEGIYGWISVNYLSHSFFNGTLGALDWGGASSQITFEVDSKANSGKNNIRDVKLMDKNFSLFVRSDLCYGKFEALRRYLALLVYAGYVKNGFISEKIESPCHGKGQTFSHQQLLHSKMFSSPCTHFTDETFLRLAKNIGNFAFVGTGNYSHCSSLILSEAFNHGNCQRLFSDHCMSYEDIPPPSSGRKFVAFSTYYYYLKSLDLLPSPPSPKAYLQILEGRCERGDPSSPNSCFEGLFLHHLLKDGYHFSDWARAVDVRSKIREKEVGWTLGYIIDRSSKNPEKPLVSFPVLLVSILDLSFLVLALTLYTICSRGARRRNHLRRTL